jgi:16S rRNA (uracil1498-N3)-methyltransferase
MTGQGTAWIVQLTDNHAEIVAPIEIQTELPVNVTLLVSLPKQGIDEIVRCCTEIGVTNIIPILSQRTLLKPSANKLTRWQRIAQEAAEQSERAIVPTIREPIPLSAAIRNYSSGSAHCYFCTARYDVPLLSTVLSGQLAFGDSVIIATGCEGGWTESEILEAQQAQFQLVSLGKRILRAMTAPITAMSLVASFSETLDPDSSMELS